MEELQDAIEDVQYINAMRDGVPRPTQDWKWPTQKEFQLYLDKIKTTAPRSFEAEGLCRGSLGFYSFMKFCKEQDPLTKMIAEFIEDVAAFRAQLIPGSLAEAARVICSSYLTEGSMGSMAIDKERAYNLIRHIAGPDERNRTRDSFSPKRTSSLLSSVKVSTPFVGEYPLHHLSLKCTEPTNAIRTLGAPVDGVLLFMAGTIIDERRGSGVESGERRGSGVGSGERRGSGGEIVEGGERGEHRSGSRSGRSEIMCVSRGENRTGSMTWRSESKDEVEKIDGRRDLHIEYINDEYRLEEAAVQTDHFDVLEGFMFKRIVDQHFASFIGSPLWIKLFKYLFLTERKVVEEDFSLFRVLGRGGFGLVNACKKCTTGKLYAMKILSKKRVKMNRAEALCLNERNILAVIQSPFVVCLKYAFTTKSDVFLILDLMTGGDLGFHLSRKGRFSEKETKYYAARTLLGLAAMHEKNIAYRDLKPENILMDEEGYTKISDLGLACKVGRSGLSGSCGTRGYWAPEMLRRDAQDKRERYTQTVDWFSFGCCLYEFMYGISPFRTDKARQWGEFPKVDKASRDRAIDLAIQQMEPDFDESVFDPIITDLITKLLIKDGKTRLGANGFQEIADHPWFDGIDWDNLCRSSPPMKPGRNLNMPTQNEIGYFVDDKLNKSITLTEEDHSTYDHWEFISRRSFQEEVVEFLIIEEKLGPITIYSPTNGCCTIC